MVHVPVEDAVDAMLGTPPHDRVDDGLDLLPACSVLLEVAALVQVDRDPNDISAPGGRGGIDHPAVAIEVAKPLETVQGDATKLHRLPCRVDERISPRPQLPMHGHGGARRRSRHRLVGRNRSRHHGQEKTEHDCGGAPPEGRLGWLAAALGNSPFGGRHGEAVRGCRSSTRHHSRPDAAGLLLAFLPGMP